MLQMWIATLSAELSLVRFIFSYKPGFSLRILVAGERCNVTGEYSERGSTSEKKIVIGYPMLAGEICVVNRELSDVQCLMNTF